MHMYTYTHPSTSPHPYIHIHISTYAHAGGFHSRWCGLTNHYFLHILPVYLPGFSSSSHFSILYAEIFMTDFDKCFFKTKYANIFIAFPSLRSLFLKMRLIISFSVNHSGFQSNQLSFSKCSQTISLVIHSRMFYHPMPSLLAHP